VNWGKSIIVAFILFGGFIATLVTLCMRQDVSLVTREYYKEELAYQEQIDRVAHTAALAQKPTIQVAEGDVIRLHYPDLHLVESGELQLFRPSDPALDKEFELRKGSGPVQYFSTEGMTKGMYRARLTWSMNGEDYFLEQVINL
jgi:hypothetical protein